MKNEKNDPWMPRAGARALAGLGGVCFAFLASGARAAEEAGHAAHEAPHVFFTLPFIALLLCIAILPLIPKAAHWWEHNTSKLMVAGALGLLTIAYYMFRGWGIHGSEPGIPAVASVLNHAILNDFIPFIVLLFALFTISGGIRLTGDISPTPLTNSAFLGIGALIASFVGTTGASMLLIRPLLQVNSGRKHVAHTVVFFIFLVSNIGGSLLPVGDPPLFLGFLYGVPFLWTFNLFWEWVFCCTLLLIAYFAVDTYYSRKEAPAGALPDAGARKPLKLEGTFNFALLAGVVFAVALLVPNKKIPGTEFVLPNIYLRELVQLGLAGLSLLLTPKRLRIENQFNFTAIGEVACLFIGIFVTMQVAIEILNARGAELGLVQPLHFFWATGLLSSVLDNAPTYVVFFQTAGALPHLEGTHAIHNVMTATGSIDAEILTAISCGAVFMGANTYIGNGPNFMVKSIAEQAGVKMPSFFGYMAYSGIILIPLFVLVSLLFF